VRFQVASYGAQSNIECENDKSPKKDIHRESKQLDAPTKY
jgi:hypothetical protein